MHTFSFNGEQRDYLIIGRGWSLPAWAPIERESTNLRGRAGAVQTAFKTGMRRFSLPITIRSKNDIDKQRFVEDMSSWLIHEQAKEMQFTKYPNRTLFAAVEGAPDFEQMHAFGEGVLNIVCFDPWLYGSEKTNVFSNDFIQLHNEGKEPTPPRFNATVLDDITSVQIFNDDAYFQLGNAVEVGTTITPKEERLLNDELGSLVGWGSTGMEVDGGIVAGAMSTNGFSIGASSYGTGTAWHGPAIKKSIPQAPLEDFKIRVKLLHKNPNISARGRMEIYLLDEQNQDFGKFAMKRTGGGSYGNAVEARAGGGTSYRYFANFAGARGVEWRDFEGVLELSRINGIWEVYVAKVDPITKKHTARYRESYPDTALKYSNGLAQVQLHIAQSGTTGTTDMRFNGIEVFRVNPETLEETNVIAVEGDEIEVDFRTKEVLLNGQPRPDLFAFGSDYFKIPVGHSTFALAPEGKLDASIRFREAFR